MSNQSQSANRHLALNNVAIGVMWEERPSTHPDRIKPTVLSRTPAVDGKQHDPHSNLPSSDHSDSTQSICNVF